MEKKLPTQLNVHPSVVIWLKLCIAMVVLMVTIGGLTRLTESGLSMTSWKPATGIFPPLTEHAWQEEFSRYRQSPEYQKKNFGMTLSEFQNIFWLEYIHRLAGRLTGMIFILPFLFFWFRNMLPKRVIWQLLGILGLGAFQGIVGWLMVKSGLKDQPYVSPYWLAFHLVMAMTIFSLLLIRTVTLNTDTVELKKKHTATFQLLLLSIGCVFFQMIMGAFVAALDAGMIYNTFPDMNGAMIPSGLFPAELGLRAWAEDVTTSQFMHRLGAYLTAFIIAITGVILFNKKSYRKYGVTILCFVSLQFLLGVTTLLWQVPIAIASLHQIVAFLLLGSLLVSIVRYQGYQPLRP